MAGWIVTVPKNLKESDRERFFQVTYEFLIERYGERNCIQAIVHNDEGGQPHMHFCLFRLHRIRNMVVKNMCE